MSHTVAFMLNNVRLSAPKGLIAALLVISATLMAGCDSKVSVDKPASLAPTLQLDPKLMSKETGLAFMYAVPQLAGEGDTVEQSSRSPYTLLEDGKPLGPAHSNHQEIREKGKGRWSHWGSAIYFSSSDGTDPRANNRKYVLTK